MKYGYSHLAGTLLVVLGVCLSPLSRSMAQSSTSSNNTYSPGVTKDLLVGDFDFGASFTGKNNFQYDAPAVSLINLYRMNNFFFQAAIGGEFDDNGNPSIGVKFMNINYLLGKGWELRAGQFDAMPFGRFPRTFDPSWIWPLEGTPKGMYALGLTNGDFGVMLQGAQYLGSSVLRSFFYITNGPTLDSSTGLIDAPIIADNNKYKMYGVRFSLSPYALSNLEIGVNAAYTRGVGDTGTQYARVPLTMWAFDFNYAPTVESLDGFLRLRGQLNLVDLGNATYSGVNYKNNSSTYFAMLAYQPSMADSPFLSKLMFSTMLSHIQVPKRADWGRPTDTQYDLGVTYWFNWRTNLKFNYSLTQHEGNAFYIHVGVQI